MIVRGRLSAPSGEGAAVYSAGFTRSPSRRLNGVNRCGEFAFEMRYTANCVRLVAADAEPMRSGSEVIAPPRNVALRVEPEIWKHWRDGKGR